MSAIRLHSFFRSSTSVRVRIALGLKNIPYEYAAWNLREGEQSSPEFLAINPQGLVPALEIDGVVLNQSIPIMEYLDERFPDPPLLPSDLPGKAKVRAIAAMIACEIHPLNNLRVLRHIQKRFGADTEAQGEWFRHWATGTLSVVDDMVGPSSPRKRFCHDNQPGLGDICIFAQLLNNRRFNLDNGQWPNLSRIFDECYSLPAFRNALPEVQPDADR
jgi:maleylacetoacetate isomerase